jgi:hypothetical protein
MNKINHGEVRYYKSEIWAETLICIDVWWSEDRTFHKEVIAHAKALRIGKYCQRTKPQAVAGAQGPGMEWQVTGKKGDKTQCLWNIVGHGTVFNLCELLSEALR